MITMVTINMITTHVFMTTMDQIILVDCNDCIVTTKFKNRMINRHHVTAVNKTKI